MKICQLCAVDFTLYHFLLPLIRAQQSAGHEVVGVCSNGPWMSSSNLSNLRTVSVPISRNLNPISHIISYIRLLKLFRQERFDVIHVHTPIAAFLGRLAAKRAGIKYIIYTAHGFYFHENMPAWKQKLIITLERWVGCYTDVLFTQAEEDAEAARKFGLCRGGIIEAIGNGVDPQFFYPSNDGGVLRRTLRAELDTPENAIVIMITGRMVAEKGYPELFKAMKGQTAILWAVGERLPSDHNKAVKEADLPGNVRLLGYRKDIADLLRSADIFVLPSHREGMPRSIIEAMMVGLPVIASDVRGSREEVVAGETGILVPVGDITALREAISRLTLDKTLANQMGKAGFVRASKKYDENIVIELQMKQLSLLENKMSDT